MHAAAPSPAPAPVPSQAASYGTSSLLRDRIRAQEENLRALRSQSPIQRNSNPVTPLGINHNGIHIPPLRFPPTNISSGASSTRSSAPVTLPQSNESATYFDAGGDLALIMRVRLDSGVQQLEVPYGVHAQSLASAFGTRHGLKSAQIHLLATAIASHLDLLDQYQSEAASNAQTEMNTWRGDEHAQSSYPYQHQQQQHYPPHDSQHYPQASSLDQLSPNSYDPASSNHLQMPSASPAPSTAVEVGSATPESALTDPINAYPHQLPPRPQLYVSNPDDDQDENGQPDKYAHAMMGDNRSLEGAENEDLDEQDIDNDSHGHYNDGSYADDHNEDGEGLDSLHRSTNDSSRRASHRQPTPSNLHSNPQTPSNRTPSRQSTSTGRGVRRRPPAISISPTRPPFRPTAPPTTGGAWKMLSNSSVSDRDVLKGLKGSLDVEEMRARLGDGGSPKKVGTSHHRPLDDAAAGLTLPLSPAGQRAAQRDLQRAREYQQWLDDHPNMPFVSPKSRELAYKFEKERFDLVQTDPNNPSTVMTKREASRRRRAEEAAGESHLNLFKVSGKSAEIVANRARARSQSGARSGASKSAALRLYQSDAERAQRRAEKFAALQERLKAEKEAEEKAACTFKPALNRLAQSVVVTEPIWARSKINYLRQQKNKVLERELRRRREEEEKHLTFRPSLNPVSVEIALAKRGELLGPNDPETAIIPHANGDGQLLMSASSSSIDSYTADRGRSLSRARSRSHSRSGSISSAAGVDSVRARSVSPSMVGHAASERLHNESVLRRARQAQLAAEVDSIAQPFTPLSSSSMSDLPGSPYQRLRETRRQLQTLDFLAKHQSAVAAVMGNDGNQVQAPIPDVDWMTEKKRMEHVHKEQLKAIHQSFLNRNDEFLKKKKEYMDRISSRFQNRNGEYRYDAATHKWEFQPFFTPHLVSKHPTPIGYDPNDVYQRAIGQVKPLHPSSTGEDASSNETRLTGPALYSGSSPQLVSSKSAQLLAKRESQRVQLLFMILDAPGTGYIDASCAALIDDIPSNTDRQIVRTIFDQQSRSSRTSSPTPAKRTSASPTPAHATMGESEAFSPIVGTSGQVYPTGSLTLPHSWRLDLPTFEKLFHHQYTRLVQRQGPQASVGVASARGSVAASRAASGSATPSAHMFAAAAGLHPQMRPSRRNSPSQSHSRSSSADPHAAVSSNSRRGSFLGALSNNGNGSLSRSGSATPTRFGLSARSGVSPTASQHSGGEFHFDFAAAMTAATQFYRQPQFKPQISSKSHALAERNHQQLLNQMRSSESHPTSASTDSPSLLVPPSAHHKSVFGSSSQSSMLTVPKGDNSTGPPSPSSAGKRLRPRSGSFSALTSNQSTEQREY